MSVRAGKRTAIHVCADVASSVDGRSWPFVPAARDTLRRTERICRHIGVVERRILAGEAATRGALLEALRRAGASLTSDGLLMLTFSGHTELGQDPFGGARWRLFDSAVQLSEVACGLSLSPECARLLIISDTCHAAALARALVGPQPALVLAGCGEGQTMVGRARSEFVVRLEDFFCAARDQVSIDDLRVLLESDTPDCERPVVWTNTKKANWRIR